MKIKRYDHFINESSVEDIENEWHSVGEYIEFILSNRDVEDYKTIVNSFIKEITPDIRIANAVNQLNYTQKQALIDQISDVINGVEKDVNVISNTDMSLLESAGGRNIFNSFLKSISALGVSETLPSRQSPTDYIIYYEYLNLNVEIVKSIFSRFKSLTTAIELIDYRYNECALYFGIRMIKSDLYLTYGIKSEELINDIGSFKLTQSLMNSLITSNYLALRSFKSEMVNLQYKDLIILARIKATLSQFDPGYHNSILSPHLSNGVLTFGYQGIGRWENGKINEQDFSNFKSNLKKWILKHTWSDKILVSINYNSFWIYVNIKNK